MKLSCLSLFLLTASLSCAESIEQEISSIPDTLQTELSTLSPDNPLQQPTIQGDISSSSPVLDTKLKSPAIAAGLSLFPGLGHAYLGDMKTAGAFAGSFGSGVGVAFSQQLNEQSSLSVLLTAQNLLQYNVYAAYRDARAQPGMTGYSYKMPTDSLKDLVYAPFNLSVLKKPEVWGGILGGLVLAGGIGYLAKQSSSCIHLRASASPSLSPLVALPVGIGEETFFRGFLQPALSEKLTPTGGIIGTSLAFGAIHAFNARGFSKKEKRAYYTFGLPFLSVAGSYFGYLAHKNGSLKESVAVHVWYDFILLGLAALDSAYTASIGDTGVSMSIPF